MGESIIPPKAYQGTGPTASGRLQQRWDKMYYNIHRNKVANARAYVDNRPPKEYPHLQERMKFYVMEEHRMAVIQRDNFTLLTKMADIMQGKLRRRIDNWNDYRVMSLNGEFRRQVLRRIERENQGVLARIEASRPHYNHKKWIRDWLDNKAYQAYIAKFPHAGTVHAQTFRGRKIKGAKKPPSRSAAHTAVYWGSNKLGKY